MVSKVKSVVSKVTSVVSKHHKCGDSVKGHKCVSKVARVVSRLWPGPLGGSNIIMAWTPGGGAKIIMYGQLSVAHSMHCTCDRVGA